VPKAITSLEGYFRKIARLNEANRGVQLYYRGHSDVDYKNFPSVFRSKNLEDSEHLMIRQLMAQQPREFREDHGIFDNLVRAQHYALPTRLLDITLNPLVALYFSVCRNEKKRASVVVFTPEVGKQKYFDSDVVACLSALSLLTSGEKNNIVSSIIKAVKDTSPPNFMVDGEQLGNFNNGVEVKKLIQLVQREKPYFAAKIQPIDLVNAVVVVPRKLHSRIIAQNGAFVIFGVAKTENAIVEKNITTEQIHIAQESKAQLLKELAQVGVSESSLFPEIDKAALAIKRRYD
jgi:hypothetical protein